MEAYRLTGNQDYLDYSLAWADHNGWQGAKCKDRGKWKYNYGETDEHVLFGDWQICFQTYADLYNILPDDRRIRRAREVMEYQMSTPQNDYWWWADGLYMVMPVMTKMYKITGNSKYLDKLYDYVHGGIDNFKDKMEILCKGLVEKYPTAKIFFFTRWNCKNFKGSDSEKVVDAMIEVCGNYSIPIFDCARKGSIYADNDTFRRIYFQKSKNNTDTAHLNSKGHDRFLKVAESFLLQY